MFDSTNILFNLSSRSYVDPIDSDQVLPWVHAQDLSQYFQVTIVTVLVYDAIITMDKEARYFWKKNIQPVNFVYFINRYVGILGAIAFVFWNVRGVNFPLCNFSQWTKNMANWVIIASIDYILMIRVLALFSQDRSMEICLKCFLVLDVSLKLGISIFLNKTIHIDIAALPGNKIVCAQDDLAPWQWGLASWVIPMIYGVVLNVLALYKAAEYWKLSAGFKGFKLVEVLIRDQVIYFALVIACCTINIMEFRLQLTNDFLSNILNAFGNPAFLSVLGSRMLFNLKEAGERGVNVGTSYHLDLRGGGMMMSGNTVSAMDFAVVPPLDGSRFGTDLSIGNRDGGNEMEENGIVENKGEA